MKQKDRLAADLNVVQHSPSAAPLYLVALIMFVEEDHPHAGNYRSQN